MRALLLLIVACVSLVFAEDTECPSLPAVQDFVVSNFTGTWYQQSGFHSFLWQTHGSCVKAEVTMDQDNGILTLEYSQKTSYGGTQTTEGFAILADPMSSEKEGRYNLTISTIFGDKTIPLSVLATDYQNYAILYSCKVILGKPYESGYVLSRGHTLDQDTNNDIETAFATIAKAGRPIEQRFRPISQEECW